MVLPIVLFEFFLQKPTGLYIPGFIPTNMPLLPSLLAESRILNLKRMWDIDLYTLDV